MKPNQQTPFVRRLAEQTLSVCCPPKLNLTLAVGKPRPDGLHPIRSLMVGLGPDFADELRLTRLKTGMSTGSIAFADDAPISQIVDWPIEKDLAMRAYRGIEEAVGQELKINFELTKRIPAGSGLGGGSSDAAGMLVGLRELFDLPLSNAQLIELGAKLGADVSFAVSAALGQRAAWVSGIGEVIEPVELKDQAGVVIILSEGRCPTAEVYREFDRMASGRSLEAMQSLIKPVKTSWRAMTPYNDLTESACVVCPELRDTLAAAEHLGTKAHVTGSGSACFVLCQDEAAARQTRQSLQQAGLAAVISQPAIG